MKRYLLVLACLLLASPAWAQGPLSDTLNSNNDRTSLDVIRSATATITVTGTWSATITFQKTGDIGDTNYASLACINEATGLLVSSTTANGTFACAAGGARRISALMTPYSSGTATVVLYSGEGNSTVGLARALPIGDAVIGRIKLADAAGALLSFALADPCASIAKLYKTISQTAGTQLITGTASNRLHICSFQIVTATAQNIALVAGTGTVCATNTVGVMGGATAATGFNLAANGGVSHGAGGFSVAATTVNADNLCLLQSGGGQVTGVLTYVVWP